MEVHKQKVLSLILFLIEKDSCTPQIEIDLGHRRNKALAAMLKSEKDRAVLDISKRAFRRRRIETRYLMGLTSIGGKTVELRIPLSSILSVYSREQKIGWKLASM